MRSIHVLWTFALTIALPTFAEPPPDSRNFETALMPKGVHQGERLDTTQRRSIRILDADEATPYTKAAGDTVFANFFHEGKFWLARLPADAVEEVYLHKDVFNAPIPVAHSQLRFRLKEQQAIELFPQGMSQKITQCGFQVK